MTGTRAVRLFAVGLVSLVAVASGAYMLIYLYRWEWTRAIVSGIFFLSAELVLVAMVLFRRIQAVEQHVMSAPPSTVGTATSSAPSDVAGALRTVRTNRPVPRSGFSWLRAGQHSGVFVPVLLGAGVLLSAIAFVLQRAAELTARTRLEPAIARDLADIAPPPGGLRPDGSHVTERARGLPRHGQRRWPVSVAVLVAALATAWIVVDRVGDATQTRPESATEGRSVVVVYVEQRDSASPAEAVRALWVGCRERVPEESALVSVAELDDHRVVLLLEPSLTDHAWRRLDGCLEDMTLEQVTARADRLVAPELGARAP